MDGLCWSNLGPQKARLVFPCIFTQDAIEKGDVLFEKKLYFFVFQRDAVCFSFFKGILPTRVFSWDPGNPSAAYTRSVLPLRRTSLGVSEWHSWKQSCLKHVCELYWEQHTRGNQTKNQQAATMTMWSTRIITGEAVRGAKGSSSKWGIGQS